MTRGWKPFILSLLVLILLHDLISAQASSVLCAAVDRNTILQSLTAGSPGSDQISDSLTLPDSWCFTLRESGNPGSNDHHFALAGPATKGLATYRGVRLGPSWWPDRITLREASRPYAEGVHLYREDAPHPQYSAASRPAFRLDERHPPLVTLSFDGKRLSQDLKTIDAWKNRSGELEPLLMDLKGIMAIPEDPVDKLLLRNRIEDAGNLASLCLKYLRSFADEADTALPASLAREILNQVGRIEELERTSTLPLAEGYYRTALKRLNNRDTASSIEALNRSIAADPFHTGALETIARISLIRKDHPAALEAVKGLQLDGDAASRLAMEHLLPLFGDALEGMILEENHTGALEICDTLLNYYAGMPEYQVTLEDLRLRSRQATVEAFLKVARQARSEGRLALARRYEDMASDQRRQWSLPEPPEPVRETTQQDTVMLTVTESKNQDLTVLPSAKQEASSTPISSPSASIPQQISTLSGLFRIILSPEPMEWSSLPTLESGLHDSLTDWVRFKGSEGRFAAWKGNAAQAQGIADTLSHLLRLPDPELQRALQDALGEITREQHASLCRQGTSESHALLYRMRRAAAEHEWENASVLLHNLLDINSRCRDCEGLAWPELSEKERILSAAEYLDLFRRAGRCALTGDFLATDSLLESARQLFSKKISDLDPDMQRDRINWAQGLPSAGYLHYLTKQYIGKQDPLEGLRCLKALHVLGEQAENTSLLQTSLGTQLAEHDLAHTTLRNPITLIAAHIGSDSWYEVLRKAYRKRFNKG